MVIGEETRFDVTSPYVYEVHIFFYFVGWNPF